jgi:spermine oxidase
MYLNKFLFFFSGSSILHPLESALPPESIRKNCPVKTIRWKRRKSNKLELDEIQEETEDDEDDGNDSDKTITDEPIAKALNDGNVEIICENGDIYFADHVIVTIPLGVLKDNPGIFDPKLPEYKTESIKNLLYGTVDKIFLEYDRPFINADISEIMLLWEPDGGDGPSSEDLLDPESEEYIKKNWFKKIYSFSKVSDMILLGWISGQEAEYMETLDQSVIADKCTEILRKFLNDPFIPKPKRCVCTSWKKQPYSRGSYTCLGIGSSQEDIENIAQPLYSNPHQSKVFLFSLSFKSSFYSLFFKL